MPLLPRLACLLALSAVIVSGAAQAQLTMVPMPREVHEQRTLSLSSGVAVLCNECDAQDTFAAQDLTEELRERGVNVIAGAPVSITLLRSGSGEGRTALGATTLTPEMQAEGYAIVPHGNGIAVVGATASGVFYGTQTVKQLIENATPATPATVVLHLLTIRDWPAMKYRGLHDDLSRGPVPTLDFQKKQVRLLSSYKVNVYSPYFENTMQYASDPLAAPPGGSITPAEARELVAYAAKYHVMVVPEQEAFGHLHFMLNWEKYSDLAETPHGHVLAPGAPGVLPFIQRMFGQLAQDYPSPLLHLGADETFELGKGATKADVDARGLGPVYLDFMQRIVAALKPLNRRFIFWGDIAYKEPALLKAAPEDFKRNTIAVAWEYNPHPTFLPYVKPYTDAGIECWVAPGVNNWNRVWPDNNLALPNIQGFTAQGQASGCTGQLNTIWDDDGEALFNANWYGVLFGAAAAWQPGQASIPQFQRSYGRAFHGDPTGKIDQAEQELTACHALLKDVVTKGGDANDFLFWVDPWTAEGQTIAAKLRPINRELRLHAEQALILVREARTANPLREPDALDVMELAARRIDMIGQKFQISDEIATRYASAYALQASKVRTDRSELLRDVNDIAHPNSVQGKMEDLRSEYSMMRDLYEQAWLKSYRPYYLHNMSERYTLNTDMWISRGDKVRAALRGWRETSVLPPASQLGIPQPPPAVPSTAAAGVR
ncbi:glycoside hydrolase family 20 zincin-like fold domain-containing protein [Terriglobus sp.]|uniref:glycoside hydrolase family 20 zincin-like fold domain-containing protein n=1 Tax=Terriglobus sp. TaxID=1889013 RepID=UPI003AFF6CC1